MASPYTGLACGNHVCRPGEGNIQGLTHDWNPQEFPLPHNITKGLPHDAEPESPQYLPLVSAARAAAIHRIVVMCAVDYDFRHIGLNWHEAIRRLGLSKAAIVYALDAQAHAFLVARGVNSVDGSANLEAWNRTRLQRHIQQAEAERHLAAAALVRAGLDVVLTEATHVMVRDPMPTLRALSRTGAIDTAFPTAGCDGKPPVGCGFWWNLAFLHGAGTAEARERAARFQLAGIRTGTVDFYLRWWNGAHCIFSGFGKHMTHCSPRLVAPNVSSGASVATREPLRTLDRADNARSTTAAVELSPGCDGVRLGLLPPSFFYQGGFYDNTTHAAPAAWRRRERSAEAMFARSPKLEGRDRLRLDRYDTADFTQLVSAMKSDGLWLLPAGVEKE